MFCHYVTNAYVVKTLQKVKQTNKCKENGMELKILLSDNQPDNHSNSELWTVRLALKYLKYLKYSEKSVSKVFSKKILQSLFAVI